MIPPGNAAVTHGQAPADQLVPPADNKVAKAGTCGIDPKTQQRYRFDPMTGRPCDRKSRRSSALRFGGRLLHKRAHDSCLRSNTSRADARRTAPAGVCIGGSKRRWSHRPVFGRAERPQFLRSLTPAAQMPTRQNDLAQIAALGVCLVTGRDGAQPSRRAWMLFALCCLRHGPQFLDALRTTMTRTCKRGKSSSLRMRLQRKPTTT